MVTLLDLWLAILVAAVFVFIASSIIHMVIPIHRSDYAGVPNEPDVMTGIREAGVKPGTYMFPHSESMKAMGSPEMIEKLNRGPVGILTVLPDGPPAMGKLLGLWFAYSVLVSAIAGYLATIGLGADASGLAVFRVTATTGLLAYGLAQISDSVWKGQSWVVTAKFIFDGLVYGAVTGAAFWWLWPSA